MEETKLEYILTHSYKADLISYLNSYPEDFVQVLQLAIADKQPYSWRAAWVLWSCMSKNDQRIQSYLEQIIDILPYRGDDQIRELLILLQHMELSEAYEGKLFDHCINIWEKIDKQPSVRFNAFKLMIKIIKKHPILSKEIKFLTEPQYLDTLSDCAIRSINKMIAGKEILPC